MRVAHVVLTLDVGGLERMVIQLCVALRRRGIDSSIVVLTDGVLVDTARQEGIDVTVLNRRSPSLASTVALLRRHFVRRKIDLVHTHNLAPLVAGTLAARLAGVPTINTRHGRAPLSAPWFIWRLTNHVVAVSEDARRELLRHNTIRADKVSVIRNGIDVSAFASGNGADGTAIRSALRIPPQDILIGTVGRLTKEKDHKTLLVAFRDLLGRGLPARLLVAGDGELASSVREMVAELGLDNRVHLLGTRSDVPALLRALNLFVLPSISEGLSLTLIEAMAAGLPIVATRVGGNPEVIADGDTGLLVSAADPVGLADALMRVAGNPSLAAALGQQARARALRHFDIDTMAQRYLGVMNGAGRTHPER